MIVEPELQGMAIHDLNQRYSRTWVKYAGNARFLHQFASLDGKPVIQWSRGEEEVLEMNTFDYKLLDISRPEAKWYWYEKNLPIYCYYRPVRQFKRGLHGDNVAVFAANQTRFILDHVVAKAMLTDTSTISPIADILNGKISSAILSKQIAMYSGNLFYMLQYIGGLRDDKIILSSDKFMQEVLDVGFEEVGVDFKMSPTKDKKKTMFVDWDLVAPIADNPGPIRVEVGGGGGGLPRIARRPNDPDERIALANTYRNRILGVDRAEIEGTGEDVLRVLRQLRDRARDALIQWDNEHNHDGWEDDLPEPQEFFEDDGEEPV